MSREEPSSVPVEEAPAEAEEVVVEEASVEQVREELDLEDGDAPAGTTSGPGGSQATTDPTGTDEADTGETEPEVEPAETPGVETTIATGRWTAGLAMAMVAGVTGLVVGSPALFLSAVVGLAYTVYGFATRPPSTAVLVERSIGDTSPMPGERVEVTVTVENVDSRAIPDLRVIDDVPEDLPVVEGSPAYAGSLRPGEAATYSYTVRARRGTHEFGATTLVCRNLSGATERRKDLDNGRSLTCEGRLEELPLDSLTVPYTGRVETDAGGEGIEFYATRQYSHGDPMRRIDWNRYARTNELTTVVYRRTEAATVVVMVDDRERSRAARRPGEPDSLALCRHAGTLIAETLLGANNRIGVAMYGDGTYLTQGGGQAQAVRARRLLEEGPESVDSAEYVRMAYGGERASTLRQHFPENAQIVFVTPLLDDAPVKLARDMEAHGHAVTVVSPDVTTPDTAGGTLARVDRLDRIRNLRSERTRVIEWSPEDPLQIAVERTLERWSG